MAESMSNADYVGARRIYEYGKNSAQYDKFGKEMDELLSLRPMARVGGGGVRGGSELRLPGTGDGGCGGIDRERVGTEGGVRR
jgi:hypothetical protein